MSRKIAIHINGRAVEGEVEPRLLLADFIRDNAGLTGTHLGCEHGVCGACTVQLDGKPVRSCLMFAVQAHGHDIATVEGMAPDSSSLHPLQQAFHESHALQCGFCTPGILMTMDAFLREEPDPTPAAIRSALAGNLCRCTGYQNIITAVRLAADRLQKGVDPTIEPTA
jgi:carbon-monoxide dehydrogenase small subunit